jgi:hypothetical protein
MQVDSSAKQSISVNKVHKIKVPPTQFKKNDNRIKIIEYTLPTNIQSEFEIFCKKIVNNPYDNPEYAMKLMEHKLKQLLPLNFLEILDNIAENGKPGLLLINNFPIDSVIPKGESPLERRDKKGKTSENAMLAFASLMNRKLESNPKEHDGAIVHQVAVFKEKENTASSKGREPLHFHVEGVHEKKPDFLMLVGLEGDPQASTGYFFVDEFLKDLPKEILGEMKKPQFEIKSGDSYDTIEKGIFALLEQDTSSGILSLRLHETLHERFKGLNKTAQNTLDFLEKRFNEIKQNNSYIIGDISLQPGQAIILNNAWGKGEISGAMHARKGYAVNPDRWLQRGYIQQKDASDNSKIKNGYYQVLQDSLKSTTMSPKEIATIWRNAMLNTKSVQTYRKINPNSSDAQAVLYGLNTNNPREIVSQGM